MTETEKYRRFILLVSVFVMLLGAMVMVGWVFNVQALKSIVPHYVTMKFNTAVGLFVIALALNLSIASNKTRWYVSALSVFVLLLGALTLLQGIVGFNLGIDQFFVTDLATAAPDTPGPGRMSEISAFCFCLMGVFMLSHTTQNKTYRLFIQWLLHLVTLLSFIAIVGYLFNVPSLYKLSVLSSMAVHTAVAFFIVSIAATFINPSIGITGLFTGGQIGNAMARRIFPETVIAVLILAYLRILAHRYFLVSVEFGIALFATSFIITTLFVLWRAAGQLNLIALQKSDAESNLSRVKAFLDASPDPIVIVDGTGMIRLASNQAEIVFGYTRQELLGKPVEILIPERYRHRHMGQRQGFFAAPRTRVMASGIELFALKKDGSEFPVEISLSPIESFDGAFVSAAIRDVSQRKKTEQQLKEVTERLVIATTSSLIGIWDLDVIANKLVWDDSMFKLYGINRNAFKGVYEAWQASVHPEDVHAANKEVEMALAGQKEFDTEFRVIWPDKSVHYIKSRATVHRDAAGKPLRMLGTNWDITERKQAELELKNSNERNRIFVEQAPNALAMFDTEMRYMAASDKWLEDYNLLDKDIIGRSHYDIFPEIGEDWKTIHRECLQGAINKADEAPFERADGTLQWLTWDVRPWYVSAGQIGGLLMYTADITHIKQKDAERRRIEHILDRSNQIAKIATWEVDAVNDTVKWSDLAYEVFDLPLGVMPTRAQAISFYKEGPNRQRLLAAVQKQIEYGTPYDLELEIETPKGNQKWIRLIGEADFEKGVCKRRFGVLQDITKAKQAEESLNLANEELQAIFNSGYVCIIGTDTRGLITHFNQGAEVLLQYSAAEMIGIHTPAKIHFSDEVVKRGAELSALYNRTIEGFDVFVEMARQGRHESREWTYIRKDGSRFPVQLIVSAIRNYRGEITGFLGVATDITERKMAEEKMRNYSILESKSKEMEQFAYVTSHDLREPLLTIKNYVKLLMEDYGASLTDEYAQIYTTAIVRSVTRMEELIKGVLDYSRLSQVKELKEVNVNNLIKDVQEDLHLLITTTGAVVEIEPLPVINAYGVELKLLFQNLINNAIKFRKKDVKPVIHISAEKIQKGWQFKIEDNGIGIEEKNSQKIFAMFQRLHNRDEYEGTGIGLAQCKKITELHNGQIWVESVPGAFSKFYFTILTD